MSFCQVHPKSASKAVNIEFEHLTRELQLQVKVRFYFIEGFIWETKVA